MSSTPLSVTLHQGNWDDRASWLLWLWSAFSLAFAQAIPTIPAATFLFAVLMYCLLFPIRLYRALTWNLIPWIIVLFGFLSVIWSEQPAQSARAAPQIAVTVLAAIMFAQGLRARSFLAICMYAFIASIVANLYFPFIFGSKNQVGLALALMMLSSFWVMLDNQQPKLCRIIALLAFLAAPSMLVNASSEGAILAGGLALLTSLVPFLLRRLHSTTRMFLVGSGVFVAISALGIALLAIDNLSVVLLDSIGKDSSLTGRTLLWSSAASIIADHPFGLGLQAFWVEGNTQAIRFWEANYIKDHYGFHFHDLWLETGVELGLIGILIAAGTTLVVFFSVWRWVLRDPGPESCFFAGFVSFILSRTLGEVELYFQFSMTSIIFLAAYCYADSARHNSATLKKLAAASSAPSKLHGFGQSFQ
jgi:exopolysaccharide production protein ExoQ